MLTGRAARRTRSDEVRAAHRRVHARCTPRPSCSRAASPAASRSRRSTPSPTCWRSSSSPSATTGTTSRCRAAGRCAPPGAFVKASGDAGRLDPPGARRSASTPPRCSDTLRPPVAGRASSVRSGQASGRLPLEGVKVADFSWIGVGPITAKALADHGATVVHVESDNPADRLRLVGPFKDDIAGINRCQFFDGRSTRRSCRCSSNLKHPDGHRRRPPPAGVVRHRPRLVHGRHDGRRSASATTSPAS